MNFKKEEYFKYVLLAVLHHQEILNHLKRISNLMPVSDQHSSKNQTSCWMLKLEKKLMR